MNDIPVSLPPTTTIRLFLTILGSESSLLVMKHSAKGLSSSSRGSRSAPSWYSLGSSS